MNKEKILNMLKNKYTYVVITAISLLILISFYLKYKYLNKDYIMKYKDAKKYIIVSKINIPSRNDIHNYSLSFWMYINDWNYRKSKDKHIITYGSVNLKLKDCYPAVYITKKINNIKILILTTIGIEKIIVKDIPIKKWCHIYINVNKKNINIYKDSNLLNIFMLKGFSMVYNKDLHLNHNGGFDGYLSSVKLDFNDFDNKILKKEFDKGPKNYNINKYYNNLKYLIKNTISEETSNYKDGVCN